jgi:hypothetical protein
MSAVELLELKSALLEPETVDFPDSPERYEIVPIGGRVKMARRAIDPLYNPAILAFRDSGLPEDAFRVTQLFNQARKNPGGVFNYDFFPAAKDTIKGMVRGPGFYRGILKTDQGPAGMFTGFTIDDRENGRESNGRVLIESIGGLAVPEVFFLQALAEKGIGVDVLNEVQDLFRKGDEREVRLALERLEITCQEFGLNITREALVGRGPFFFIRPAIPEGEGVRVSRQTAEQVNTLASQLLVRLEMQAFITKRLVRQSMFLPQAMVESREVVGQLGDLDGFSSSIPYFQTDVILKKDGTFVIDRINIPDVVFFLSQVDSQGLEVFDRVQDIVADLSKVVVDRLEAEIRNSEKKGIVLVTRDDVVDDLQDTLEILEIKALIDYLEARGIEVDVCRLSDAGKLTKDQFVMLMNIRPKSEGFEVLLDKSAQGEVDCYPDPFLLLFKENMHTYPEVFLRQSQIIQLEAIVKGINHNKVEEVYCRIMALEAYLNHLGFSKEDIFYITDGSGRIAPAFRYDLRSFACALGDFDSNQELRLRALDFRPEEAMVTSKHGSHLAAFRFMCVKKQNDSN